MIKLLEERSTELIDKTKSVDDRERVQRNNIGCWDCGEDALRREIEKIKNRKM